MNLSPAAVMNGLYIALFVIAAYGLLRKRLAPTKTVPAEVIGKQTVEQTSKYSASGKTVKYVIIFLTNGKKLSFYVSEFSYGGYRQGEKGTLTYKGDRLIDFH